MPYPNLHECFKNVHISSNPKAQLIFDRFLTANIPNPMPLRVRWYI